MNSNIASMQYQLSQGDLRLILALVRGGSLSRAAELLAVDTSTVFRAIHRLEKSLGAPLFDKTRSGYLATDLARSLASPAEQAEQALEAARLAVEGKRDVVSGSVRLTCTDSVLHGLLLPALRGFMANYPLLTLELVTSNDFANLSRRDADVALRLTTSPPPHLVGRCLGEVPYVLCMPASWPAEIDVSAQPWITPDDFLPDHATVTWRRRVYPGVQPAYRCSSVFAVAQMVRAGLGVGVVPAFLAQQHTDMRICSPSLPDCTTALWLLTRPDCRAMRSVSVLFDELARHVRLAPLGGKSHP